MLGLVAALLVGAPQNVIGAGGGNALTLPAARHLVRLDPQNGKPATWLLAVQQDSADGHWLSMYRSTDEAQTWSWYAPIQDACCERDTPDLVQIGMDVALAFSYEGPDIAGDRKSTRLNSSHLGISYAVFCLKKKKKTNFHIFIKKKKNKTKRTI